MILRTITDDITGANKSIGLFGKSLNDFKGILNSFKQNGFVNSLLNTPLINIDTDAIDIYNNAIRAGKTFEDALATARRTTNAETIALIESSHGAEVQTERVTAAQNASTIAAKAHSAALKALSIAGNMILFALISKGIESVVKGFDNWIHRVEKANEAMNEAVGEYESAKSSLESVNSELDKQNKQLDELLAKDELTYAEKGQLEELQAITQELLLQQDIEERRAENASKEAADKAVDAYKKQYGRYDNTEEDLQEKLSYENPIMPESKDDVLGMIAGYVRAQELLEQSQKDFDDALANGEDTTWLAENVQFNIDVADDYRESLDGIISDLQEKRLALKDEYNKAIEKRESDVEPLTSSEKDIIDTYEKIYDLMKIIYKYTDQHSWNNMEINDIFNTAGIEKTKKELIAMAKAGELSPQTLEQYPKLNDAIKDSELFLKDGQAAAEAFCNEIIACADEADSFSGIENPIFTAFTEEQSQSIDDFQSKVKTLSDALSALKSGSLDNGALTDLIQEFPELEGQSDNLEQAITDLIYHSLQKLYDTLGEGLPDDVKNDLQSIADTATGVTPQLGTAFSAIQKSYDALQDFKDAMSTGMTDDALSSVASLSTKLNDLVAGFYAGTVSADDLYEALKEHYNSDLNNYGNALIAKNELSKEFYNSVVLNNTEFINTFKNNYGIDLKNYKSYHEAKLDIAVNTIEALGKNWSKYYDAQALALTADGKRLLSTMSQSSSEESHKQYAEIMSQISQFEQAKKAMNDLNNVIYKDIESNFSSVSNAFGSNSAKSEFSETIDFFERRIEVLDTSLDLLSASLENVTGSFAKNSIIDGQLSINKEKIENYTDALAMYTGEANKILSAIPSDIAEKVKNGAVSLTDFVGDGNEAVVEAIGDYKAWADKISDCNQQLTLLKQTIAQLELDKFNNIAQDFDDQNDLRDSAISNIDKQIALLEEMGELVGASYYEAQKSLVEKQLETLTGENGERNRLAKELADALANGSVQAGSDEWLDMVKTLSDVDGKILDCKKAIEEYDNAILQLDWNTFERQQEAISNIDSELSHLVDLFDDIDVADDTTGEWTADALAKLGLLTEKYELAQDSVGEYDKAIAELKRDYADGKYSSTEYAEKLAELSEGQWKAIDATEAAKDAIAELNEARANEVIDGIEEEKDAYKELVDAQIDALDAEKKLHDYKKSIQEKSKNVTDLERQISALQNDTSAAGIAKRKKLEAELADAKEELEEAEYEHSI